MRTLKAGCFLINRELNAIGLIYRENRKDYSFPKGHLEGNETLQECAVRETEEETKRACKIVSDIPNVEKYTTPTGEACECHMFLAVDTGKSDNASTDSHTLIWVPFDEVENTLTYSSLRKVWSEVKGEIKKVLDSKN